MPIADAPSAVVFGNDEWSNLRIAHRSEVLAQMIPPIRFAVRPSPRSIEPLFSDQIAKVRLSIRARNEVGFDQRLLSLFANHQLDKFPEHASRPVGCNENQRPCDWPFVGMEVLRCRRDLGS